MLLFNGNFLLEACAQNGREPLAVGGGGDRITGLVNAST
jgi:hypothetical protein